MQSTPKVQSRGESVKCYAAKKAPAKKGAAGRRGWLGSGESFNVAKWYGKDRTMFLPDGIWDRTKCPEWMDGTLPGDYGYDVLRIGSSKERVEQLRRYELIHARWAMLGTAGMIIPEALASFGADIKGSFWYETGAAMLDGGTLNYFAVPWTVVDNKLPLFGAIAAEVALIGAVEFYRAKGTGPKGYSPGVGNFTADVFDGMDTNYPGGPFDPLGLADDPDVFEELKIKEIKNGRLAMVASLAYAV